MSKSPYRGDGIVYRTYGEPARLVEPEHRRRAGADLARRSQPDDGWVRELRAAKTFRFAGRLFTKGEVLPADDQAIKAILRWCPELVQARSSLRSTADTSTNRRPRWLI